MIIEEQEFGIDNIKEALSFVIKTADGYISSMEDGKLSAMDAFNFIGSFQSAFAAFADVDQLKYELANLDEDEKAELYAYIEEEISYEAGSVEMILENSLRAVIAIGEVISQFFQEK